MRRLLRRLVRVVRAFWAWLNVGTADLHYYAGLVLVAAGVWMIWPPLGLVAFGGGLVWWARIEIRMLGGR